MTDELSPAARAVYEILTNARPPQTVEQRAGLAQIIADRLAPVFPNAPVIVDPEGDDWPAEPKVTHAEILLYGDLAGPVRLLGQAASSAADAYSLVCKRHGDGDGFELDYEIQRAWQTYQSLRGFYFELAARAQEMVRQVELAAVRDHNQASGGGGAATWLAHQFGEPNVYGSGGNAWFGSGAAPEFKVEP